MGSIDDTERKMMQRNMADTVATDINDDGCKLAGKLNQARIEQPSEAGLAECPNKEWDFPQAKRLYDDSVE